MAKPILYPYCLFGAKLFDTKFVQLHVVCVMAMVTHYTQSKKCCLFWPKMLRTDHCLARILSVMNFIAFNSQLWKWHLKNSV